jgi:hypothetical protein
MRPSSTASQMAAPQLPGASLDGSVNDITYSK